MQRSQDTEATTTKRGHDGGCRVDIRIETDGDVNIYNCAPPQPAPPAECPPEEEPSRPIAPGQCVPVTLGAKPKQSQKSKLDRVLATNRVPSALAASFFHVSRRFLAGHSPANPLEASAFGVLQSLSPRLRRVLSCSLSSFDSLPTNQRDQLFASALRLDPDAPLDPETLAAAVAAELVQRVGVQVFDDPSAVDEERPGQNRFFDPGSGETFEVQLRICRVNGLRTNEFAPALAPGEYEPAELQQHCEPVLVDGEPQLNCHVLTDDCPGNFLSDRTCLRVPEVETGQAVVLEGVNFISVDATVRLAAKEPGTVTRDVDAHVVGDIDTPLNEVVDGETVPIRDCRVRDRLTFRVPDDLAPGVYSVQVAMPNVSGIPVLGDPILSNVQYINVLPPATARFQIASETLHARQETWPASFGSDEVRVRVSAFPITVGPTALILGEEQRFDSPEFGDVDSGDTRDMTAVLFSHTEPVSGVAMTVLGYEIDSETAYQEEIDSFTDAFVHYLKIALEAIGGAVAAGALAIGLKDLLALGLAHPLILAIAVAVVLAVVTFLALWAPADLIIEDEIGLTAVDLAALTNANFPAPAAASYRTHGGLQVNVNPVDKRPSEYSERREYVSEDEDSRYEITLRYNRVA
jgi:hypothetical protein